MNPYRLKTYKITKNVSIFKQNKPLKNNKTALLPTKKWAASK